MTFPFDPATRSFSRTNALGTALAAQLAYADPQAIDATLEQDWGFEGVRHYVSSAGARDDTQAFLAIRRDVILVAFRGTEPREIKDWLTDAEVALIPTELGHLHAGFWRAFSSVWPAMLRDIQAVPGLATRSLWFTGHSLGAALSTLATASCRAAGVAVAGHYNFGSPRVGDASFTNAYNEHCAATTFRFVNNNDVVTRIPPRELSYGHVDFRKYLDSRGRLLSDARMIDLLRDSFEGSLRGLQKLFAQVAQDREKGLPLPDFLEDHRIANYITCIGPNG